MILTKYFLLLTNIYIKNIKLKYQINTYIITQWVVSQVFDIFFKLHHVFKGCRMGQSDKVSLWYVALLINTRFRFFILE